MTYSLSQRSLDAMKGVHPDLIAVVRRAIKLTTVDFVVLEGMRTLAKQKQLVAKGASKTMNSRHLTGHAVDLGAWVGGQVRWDWPLYHKIAEAMQQAADELDIAVISGANWETFPDGPHHELNRKFYP